MSLRNAEVSNDLNHPRDVEAVIAQAPAHIQARILELRNAPTDEAKQAIMKRRGMELRAEKRSAAPSPSLSELAWKQFTGKFPTPVEFRAHVKAEADAKVDSHDGSRTYRKALLNSILN